MAANIEDTTTGDREVYGRKYGRLTARFEPEGVWLRQKGTQKEYGPVPWSWIFERGMRLELAKK